MDWNKLKPWNWFKKEQDSNSSSVPVARTDAPGLPMTRLHQEMDRLFESFLRSWGMPVLPDLGTNSSRWMSQSLLRPSVDISENKDRYTIRVELPGVEKESLSLSVDDDTLVISGEKHQQKEESEGGYHCVESSYGSFRRLLSLPEDADQEKLDAKFKNGVLTITLPRLPQPENRGREIAIS